jgi:hypothetical protein
LPSIFPTQEKVAEKLLDMVKEKLQANSHLNIDLFQDFKFLILLPNRVSLEEQTKDRMKREDCFTKSDLENVVRICPSSENMKNKWNEFIKEALECPNTWYLIVHDECHWAAGQKGTFNFLGFDKGDYHFPEGKLLPNLFTLMVSATPYNFFTSPQLKSEDILNWNDYLQSEQITNDYQGITSLRQQDKIESIDLENIEGKENIEKHFASVLLNGFSKEFIYTLLDYLSALQPHADQFQTHQTVSRSMEKCIKEKKIVVVRLESAFDEIRQTEVAKQAVKTVASDQNVKLEVLVNSSSEDNTVGDQIAHDEHKDIVLKNLQKKNLNMTSLNKLQLADLKDIPAIVFIIEQCRMGDTFPSTCVCFDLRPRYLQPVKDFTSIIQDVGRAFGYGERPTLLLSPKADEFLKTIWDNQSQGISWENLKNQLTKVVLGKNMSRRPEFKGTSENACNLAAKNEQQQALELSISDLNSHCDFLMLSDFLEGDQDSLSEWSNLETEEDTQTEQPKEVVRLFQDIYQADSKQPVFLYNLKLTGEESAFQHRIILKAEPQIGKTGSFLHLITMLCRLLRYQGTESRQTLPFQQTIKNLREYSKEFYEERTTQQIKSHFQTPEGRLEYRDYMKKIQYAREKREKDKVLEPSKWAALCVIDDLKKNNPGSIS